MYRFGNLAVIVLIGLALAGDILFTVHMAGDMLAWGP